MADKIKTRTVQKNIKVLDKSVSTLDRMQRKTRETADSTARQDEEETPVSYAENRRRFSGTQQGSGFHDQ